MTDDLLRRIRNVELLVLDVDGVLTDGRIVYTSAGDEVKSFHVHDGSALKLWRQSGRKTAVLSGRQSPAVERRLKELRIETVELGVSEKVPRFLSILQQLGVTPEQTAVVGDDLPDVPLMKLAAVSAAPCDAVDEARSTADLIAQRGGGAGAVREVVRWLMIHQGTWEAAVRASGSVTA